MFPSHIEALAELATLDPESLVILARRYERLAKQCRSAAKYKSEHNRRVKLEKDQHAASIKELRETVWKLYRRGFKMATVRECLYEWDPAIVNFQYREARKIARQKNGLSALKKVS